MIFLYHLSIVVSEQSCEVESINQCTFDLHKTPMHRFRRASESSLESVSYSEIYYLDDQMYNTEEIVEIQKVSESRSDAKIDEVIEVKKGNNPINMIYIILRMFYIMHQFHKLPKDRMIPS